MTMEERIRRGEIRDQSVVQELVWGRDYFVRYIPMPIHIHGCCTMNYEDYTYNIYINSRLFADQQWRAFLHELLHIECGHLDQWKDLPIEVKEWEADHLQSRIAWTAEAC